MLETLVLSVLNHDSAIASAAARMVTAAGGRPGPLIEMGSRRTHEEAAVAVAGRPTSPASPPPATSPPAALRRPHRRHRGARLHPGARAARTRRSAARSRRTAPAPRCWSTPTTSRRASATPSRSPAPGSARSASTPATWPTSPTAARAAARRARRAATRITVTSDLDEYVIAALADAPIDGYGVGTRVVTGSGHPTASMVYKLVASATSRPAPCARSPRSSPARSRSVAARPHAGSATSAEVPAPSGPPPTAGPTPTAAPAGTDGTDRRGGEIVDAASRRAETSTTRPGPSWAGEPSA